MAEKGDYTNTSHETYDPNASKREEFKNDIESKNKKINTFISVLRARLDQEMTDENKNEIDVTILKIREFMDQVVELGGKPNYDSILNRFDFSDIAAMHDRNSSNSTKQKPEPEPNYHQDDDDDYENEDREQQNSNYGHREPDVDQSYKNETNYQTQENYTNFSRTDVINELNLARKSKNIQEIIRLTKILSQLR